MSAPPLSLYRELNSGIHEVRLIRWPDTRENTDVEVRCELVYQSLDDNPTYAALSYVWGDTEPARRIFVDSQEVSVAPSLYSALRRLRDAGRDIWADALCINQQNDEEKSAQVQLMARIYQQADIVISWLGEGGDGVDVAVDFLRLMKDELQRCPDSFMRMLQGEEAWLATTWLAVRQLLQHPYWGRVWILQEVLLAQNPVLCAGEESCPMDVLHLLLVAADPQTAIALPMAAREALFFPGVELARGLSMLYNGRFGGKKMTLMDSLVLARERRATNPRDYIYGLLSLVDGHAIVPDYSAPVATVYTKLVGYMIEQDKTLDILSACLPRKTQDSRLGEPNKAQSLGEASTPEKSGVNLPHGVKPGQTSTDEVLPSWVPDWRIWASAFDYLFLAKKTECHYRASLASTPQVEFSDSSRTLIIQGILFDTVRVASPSNHSSEDADGIGFTTRDNWNLWQTVRTGTFPYGDENAQAVAFEKAFFAGQGSDWINEPVMTRFAMIRAGEDMPTPGSLVAAYLGENILNGNRVMMRRQFFVTDGGYMGYGLGGLEKGDIVVVLLGGKVPFVLRPVGDHYLLRDVQAIMEGEMMTGVGTGQRKVQKFFIK